MGVTSSLRKRVAAVKRDVHRVWIGQMETLIKPNLDFLAHVSLLMLVNISETKCMKSKLSHAFSSRYNCATKNLISDGKIERQYFYFIFFH